MSIFIATGFGTTGLLIIHLIMVGVGIIGIVGDGIDHGTVGIGLIIHGLTGITPGIKDHSITQVIM